MGQRHNRRRTRPRSRNRSINLHRAPIDTTHTCTAAYPSTFDCLGNRPASTRHYRGLIWQEREGTTVQEMEQQYRLFGGEPGDDVSLCYRMLEYFGGLDYIDT